MAKMVKVNGTWRTVSMPYTKVDGVWKAVKAGYTNVSGTWRNWWLQGGIRDITLPSYPIAGPMKDAMIQPDGKIIIPGQTYDYSTFPSVPFRGIVRFNSDITVDTSFSANIGSGTDGYISSAALQSDGKILVCGVFSSWNGNAGVKKIVRLNADGTRDTSFSPNIEFVSAGEFIRTMAIQADGKIVVSTSGRWPSDISRLNVDGTEDIAFALNTDEIVGSNYVTSTIIQPDGKILVGGNFSYGNGPEAGIVRLNSNGTLDTSFMNNVGTGIDLPGDEWNGYIAAMALQPDGKIIVAGSFSIWNNSPTGNIIRLNSNGTRDVAFSINVGSGSANPIFLIHLQDDGKIILGASSEEVEAPDFWNGMPIPHIIRLNSNGTLDTAFTSNISSKSSSLPGAILNTSNNKIIVIGASYDYKESDYGNIIRMGGGLAQ